MKIYLYDVGYMSYMVKHQNNMSYMVKHLKYSSSGPISMKLGMQHWGLQPIIVCLIDNPGLPMTFFMAKSSFAT